MRPIIVKYQGECRKCGATLVVGDKAIYERRIGIFCPECEPQDSGEIRQYRQESADRKADKYEEWAAKRTTTAMATLNHNRIYTSDLAFNTQPGRIPLRARVIKQNDRALESLETVRRFEDKAQSLRHVRVKGDAEKRWQGLRDLNLTRFKVGDMVDTGIYGKGEVLRLNKKTAKVGNTGKSGTYTVNVDLAFLSPIHPNIIKAETAQ